MLPSGPGHVPTSPLPALSPAPGPGPPPCPVLPEPWAHGTSTLCASGELLLRRFSWQSKGLAAENANLTKRCPRPSRHRLPSVFLASGGWHAAWLRGAERPSPDSTQDTNSRRKGQGSASPGWGQSWRWLEGYFLGAKVASMTTVSIIAQKARSGEEDTGLGTSTDPPPPLPVPIT